MSNYPIYETERLLLKAASAEDADLVLELYNSPKWLQHIGDRNVRTLADAEAYIAKKMTPQLERLGYGNFTVIRKSDGAKMGLCGLYDREGLEGVDIGFAFLPQYEKQGYAYESALKIKHLGFERFGVSKILGITTKENVDSQRLLEKLGLRHIDMVRLPDDEEELMLYEVSKTI